ncbi:MAG: histidine kinase dimerization/phospho-acceptor domain-containing protein, partial [Brachymonas sp.]
MLFALVPTALVGALLYRSHVHSIDALSEKIVSDVAHRVRKEMESQLALANSLLNGIVESEPTPAQIARARGMLANPLQFEALAHTLARMNPQTPFVFMGTAKGEYLGVQSLVFSSVGLNRVGVQTAQEQRRRYYEASQAGDRSNPQAPETANFDPRLRPWYSAAVNERGRITTPVYISASSKQLIITMAQPVFDPYGGSLGVFGVDLTLRELNDTLRLISISRRGAAMIVDEDGMLIAMSTGEDLSRNDNGKQIRMRPDESSNLVIRAVWTHVADRAGKREQDSIQRQRISEVIDSPAGRVILNMQPISGGKGLPMTMIVAAPVADFSAEAEASLARSTYFMVAVVLLAAVLGGLLAWRLTRRFRALVQAAEQMGQGMLPRRQGDARIREVRRLSSALHSSAREIIENREALQQANEHLEERVALRTHQLQESREEALQAAKAKAAFLATMSHEIRTPLNGVVGMTTLMADTPLSDEQKDYLHTMRVSSDQLLSVINDILDYPKIESGKMDLENEPLSLQATVEEACDIGAPRAREKGLELLVDVGDEVPAWVRGDVTRLRQILLNFLGNAVKFTEKGQILVSVHLKEDFDATRVVDGQPSTSALVQFRVKDSGIGIPKDRQSALFQSFTQVDASTTRKYGGTG